MGLKEMIRRIPLLGSLARRLRLVWLKMRFRGSENYWQQRYADGGNSGPGSFGEIAQFKAKILNGFVTRYGVESIIEFGFGDGNQLSLSVYPDYLGFELSPRAVASCKQLFVSDPTKRFKLMDEYDGEHADLALSIDVIFHITEDEIFDAYMCRIFDSARKFVIIYSSNCDEQTRFQAPHIKHRKFMDWIDRNRQEWKLIEHIPNKYPFTGIPGEGSMADFYIFQKQGSLHPAVGESTRKCI
jgi:hypothetical protein